MKRITAGATALLLIAIAGCSSQPTSPPSSASPSASASVAAASPVAVPSSSPSGDPSGGPVPSSAPSVRPSPDLAIDSVAAVVTNDLRVRSKPEVSDASKKLEPLLDAPRHVFIVDGPVTASGYVWYEVAPIRDAGVTVELPFGWVAAADKDGTPWLAPTAAGCPATPRTVDSLFALDTVLGLACFGATPFSVTARLAQPEATCGIDIGWSVDPDWLSSTCPQPKFLLESPTALGLSAYSIIDPSVNVASFRPGVDPADWLNVRLTGRFDHRAARTCRGVSSDTPVPLSDDQIVLGCRATWVITRITSR